MGSVIAHMAMSLDGFIASLDDQPGPLFDWYEAGEVATPTAGERLTFHTDPASAEILSTMMGRAGALICGRRLFDLTGGWGGQHPAGCPVVVVTHAVPEGWPRDDAPFTFVTDGIERAVEKAGDIAGDNVVGVNGGTIARQCLNAGLLDEIWVDLVPVLLGHGTPFFDQLVGAPVELEGPTSVAEGNRVTHLRYRVRKS